MKPTRGPWAVLILVLGALGVLAWLQIGWSEEASRAQAYQMKERLVAAGAQAGSSLEVERIVLREFVHNLRLTGGSLAMPPRQAVEEAFRFWRDRTRTPRILKRLWLVGPDSAAALDASGRWTEADRSQVPTAIRGLADNLSRRDKEPDPALFGRDFFPAEPVRFSPFLLMVPEVDLDAVIADLLPDLLSQAFGGDRGMADLVLSVRDASGTVLYRHGPEAPAETSPVVTRPLWVSGWGNPILRLWLHQNPEPDEARWTLEVRYAGGSPEEVFERIRWTNLSAGLTLLAVLAAGILLLFTLYRRSRRMVRSQNAFVASVSHELRTPLAVLRSAAENMKEGLVTQPDQAVRYGARMLEESDRLLQLTENVLSYARLGSQRVVIANPETPPVDLTRLTAQAAAGWTEAVARAGGRLSVEVPPGPVWVRGDEGALKAVLANLLSNALRHGLRPGGTVQITLTAVVQPHAPVARLEVRDDGPGIPARDRRRVFEPFYQSSRKTGGVGLGLALVQRIAEAHGGTARFLPGRGAWIRVDFPAGLPE